MACRCCTVSEERTQKTHTEDAHRRTQTHTDAHRRRMRSVCNHHSKILQHHRNDMMIASSPDRTHTYDACDPFVIITPRFYNIIASSPDRTHTHTCNVWDPFVIITPRFTTSSHDRLHAHARTYTHAHTTHAIRL